MGYPVADTSPPGRKNPLEFANESIPAHGAGAKRRSTAPLPDDVCREEQDESDAHCDRGDYLYSAPSCALAVSGSRVCASLQRCTLSRALSLKKSRSATYMKVLSDSQRAAWVRSVSSHWREIYDGPDVFPAGHP